VPERSPASASFASFLGRSLDAIAAECPPAHAAMTRALRGRDVTLVIDDEAVGLRGEADRLAVGTPRSDAVVEFRSRRRTLVDLTSGRDAFLDAVLAGRIEIRGPVGDIALFHDALFFYLSGAVRSPSLPTLLAAFAADQGDSHP
jgi:hypothetical protein